MAQLKAWTKPEQMRKTRMTFNTGTSTNKLINLAKHLARMHTVVEFLMLVHDQFRFSKECYQKVAQVACDKYMSSNSPIEDIATLQKNRLCDLSMSINSIDEGFINKLGFEARFQLGIYIN